jgi:hypothetical protein
MASNSRWNGRAVGTVLYEALRGPFTSTLGVRSRGSVILKARCPRCRAVIPLLEGVEYDRGVAHYRCPACGARLKSLSEQRMFPGGMLLLVFGGALFGFLPFWLAIPLAVVGSIWLWRWTSALEEVPG